MMTRVRNAVGGRWATSLRTWALLAVPSLLPVIVQESLTLRVTSILIVITATLQHLASAVPLVIAELLRRKRATIPVWSFLLVWSSIAVVRGFVGGAVGEWLTGTAPHYPLRIAFWLGITWIWVPVFVYVRSQIDLRREYEKILARAIEQRDAAVRERSRIESTLLSQLVATVHSTVMPVIDDIRRGLIAASESFDPVSLRAISDRLALVTDEATRIVSGDPADEPVIIDPDPPPMSFFHQFASGRISPIVTAAFTAVLLTAVIVPASTLSRRDSEPLESLWAVAASSTSLLLLLLVGARLCRSSPQLRGWCAAASSIAAGLIGSLVLLQPYPVVIDQSNLILAALFPLAVLGCAVLVTAAGALTGANERMRERVAEVSRQSRKIENTTARIESRVRAQLATVMHGPVYGRLSACVMALNFSAHGGVSTDSYRGRAITAGIIDHLDRASQDLDRLRKDSPP